MRNPSRPGGRLDRLHHASRCNSYRGKGFPCPSCAVCHLSRVSPSLIASKRPEKVGLFFSCLNWPVSFWLLLLFNLKNVKQYAIYCPRGLFPLSLLEESRGESSSPTAGVIYFAVLFVLVEGSSFMQTAWEEARHFSLGVSQHLKISSPHLSHSVEISQFAGGWKWVSRLFLSCLAVLFCDKILNKNNLGRKGFISPYRLQLLVEASQYKIS